MKKLKINNDLVKRLGKNIVLCTVATALTMSMTGCSSVTAEDKAKQKMQERGIEDSVIALEKDDHMLQALVIKQPQDDTTVWCDFGYLSLENEHLVLDSVITEEKLDLSYMTDLGKDISIFCVPFSDYCSVGDIISGNTTRLNCLSLIEKNYQFSFCYYPFSTYVELSNVDIAVDIRNENYDAILEKTNMPSSKELTKK